MDSFLDSPLTEIQVISPRLRFQYNCAARASGQILDVGCSDDPLGFRVLGSRCVHFDIDDWSDYYEQLGAKFVQGDAHCLTSYFEPNSFELVILGDVAEHLENPIAAILEAAKVTNHWLCLTIWEETRLPAVGYNRTAAWTADTKTARAQGYEDFEDLQKAQLAQKGAKGYPERKVAHAVHIWRFDDALVDVIIEKVCQQEGLHRLFYQKVPEVVHEGTQFYNWLVLLEKENSNANLK